MYRQFLLAVLKCCTRVDIVVNFTTKKGAAWDLHFQDGNLPQDGKEEDVGGT